METGYRDDVGRKIMVGDILANVDGYRVLVCYDGYTGKFYGSLICRLGDSCRDIPYALNKGEGFLIICNRESVNDSRSKDPRFSFHGSDDE